MKENIPACSCGARDVLGDVCHKKDAGEKSLKDPLVETEREVGHVALKQPF